MGLKHLQASVWAVWLASAVGALAQPNPPDSDGDTVPDHTDICPQTAGSPDNSGCPADEEIVMAYGTRLSTVWGVTCPDGSAQVFWDLCPTFGTWGTFAIGLYENVMGNTHIGTYTGNDGYQPPAPSEPEPEEIEVTAGGNTYTCYGVATAVTLTGGGIVAAGFLVGVIATEPPTPTSISRPVYDQSGYLFDDHVYFDPPFEGNPALAAVSVGLGIAGSVVVLSGVAMYAGCFVAGA